MLEKRHVAYYIKCLSLGKYTIHLGLHDSNLDPCTVDALPLAEDTVADVLKGQGYSTHLIGESITSVYQSYYVSFRRITTLS